MYQKNMVAALLRHEQIIDVIDTVLVLAVRSQREGGYER